MCTGYTQEQIRDCYDWFEEELRPLLENGASQNEEVWTEGLEDDDVVQKVNPMNMHVVVSFVFGSSRICTWYLGTDSSDDPRNLQLKAWGLDGGEEGDEEEDEEDEDYRSDQSEDE